jgi:putative hydrolase of the HAD superfamily
MPAPRAYARVAEGLGVAARDCVFIDDQAHNFRGAASFFLATIHFDVSDLAADYAPAIGLLGLAPGPGEQSGATRS